MIFLHTQELADFNFTTKLRVAAYMRLLFLKV